MRRWLLAVLAVLAAFAALLGWGWWHAHTHATVDLAVNDLALRTPHQGSGPLTSGELVLRDAAGQALAHGRLSEPYGVVVFTDSAAGDCDGLQSQATTSQAGRDAWQHCFAARSRWQAQWAARVAQASVATGRCDIGAVAVRAYRNVDWWLWWVPLPHVGGTPYTSYSFRLRIDSARCAPASPDP